MLVKNPVSECISKQWKFETTSGISFTVLQWLYTGKSGSNYTALILTRGHFTREQRSHHDAGNSGERIPEGKSGSSTDRLYYVIVQFFFVVTVIP